MAGLFYKVANQIWHATSRTYNWGPNSFLVEVGVVVDQVDADGDVNEHKQGQDQLVKSDEDVAPFFKTFTDCIMGKLLELLAHLYLWSAHKLALINIRPC